MRARERILDAAVELIERSGFDAVNIAAVAAGAGVSRQTVYANFGCREEVLSQALARVTGEVLARIDASIAPAASAAEYAVELLVATRSEFRRHPVLGALAFPDRASPLFDDQLFARGTAPARQFLEPLVRRDPRLAGRLDDVVEVCMRMGISVLLFDSDAVRSDDDLRAFLHRSLVPALGLG